MKAFGKNNRKTVLGILFILLALTPVLLMPLNRLFWCIIYGGLPKGEEILSWFNMGWSVWVLSAIYFLLGVNFIIQRAVPSAKLPQWFYAIVFGVLTFFAVNSLIGNFKLFNYFRTKNLERYWGDMVSLLFNMVANFLKLIGFIAVIIGLLVKSKSKILSVVPITLFIVGGAMSIIGTLVEIVYVSYLIIRAGWWGAIFIFLGYDYLPEILFSLGYIFAMVLFCCLFIMHTDGKAANNTNSVVATPAKAQPQLTAAQKEELANAQELFELGAYSEEEFEAEKQRIIYGL